MARASGSLLGLAAVFLSAQGASTGEVEVAPFAGVQFGGSHSVEAGFQYGATVDVALGPSWGVELLYSRQAGEQPNGRIAAPLDLEVERYMVGIQEKKGEGRARFFGVFLVGLSRFAPGFVGYDPDERFTLGASLGVKTLLSRRFGVRGEARGFFAIDESAGGIVCSNGACLFRYGASGLWQGDVTAAVYMAF